MSNFNIVVARTAQEAEQFRPIWNKWSTHRDNDIDYCVKYVWDGENCIHPYVMLLLKDGCPDAMLVGRVEHSEMSSKIGYARVYKLPARVLTFSYPGVLGSPSAESCEILVESVLAALRNKEADVAMLHSLLLDSSLHKIARNLPVFVCRDHVVASFPHRSMELPGSLEEVYRNLSAGLRAELRRKKRKIEADFKGALSIECFRDVSGVDIALPQVEEIARKTYQRGIGVGFDNSPGMRKRLQVCAEHGWLRIYVLTISSQPRAFWIGTVFKNVFCSDYNGYDPEFRSYSLGTYLLEFILDDLCKNGITTADFGMGESEWKERFGNRVQFESSVYIFAPRAKGVSLNLLRAGTSFVDRALRKGLRRLKLLDAIKRRWRERLSDAAVAGR